MHDQIVNIINYLNGDNKIHYKIVSETYLYIRDSENKTIGLCFELEDFLKIKSFEDLHNLQAQNKIKYHYVNLLDENTNYTIGYIKEPGCYYCDGIMTKSYNERDYNHNNIGKIKRYKLEFKSTDLGDRKFCSIFCEWGNMPNDLEKVKTYYELDVNSVYIKEVKNL